MIHRWRQLSWEDLKSYKVRTILRWWFFLLMECFIIFYQKFTEIETDTKYVKDMKNNNVEVEYLGRLID